MPEVAELIYSYVQKHYVELNFFVFSHLLHTDVALNGLTL